MDVWAAVLWLQKEAPVYVNSIQITFSVRGQKIEPDEKVLGIV